jgi:hypothetical protein
MYWKSRANFFRLDRKFVQGYLEHNFSNRAALQRASLNWRLTHKEKLSILSSIHTQKNEASLDQAKLLVGIH